MSKSWKTKEDRAAEMDQISKQLEEGVKQYFTSETYMDYLKTMSKFHNYSFNNIMLIALQKPDASMVAGYNTWKDFNRHVVKGEKGIRILAPAPIRKEIERDVFDPVTRERSKETVETIIPMFKPTYVYDVSQTEGETLKLPRILELKEQVEDYETIKEAVKRISKVPISFEHFEGEAKGYFIPAADRIVIKEGLGELQTVKTMLHELSHSILHNKEKMTTEGPKDSKTKEVEAESVAYTVCTHLGLDTSDYSFPYIALWAEEQDLSQLRKSMDYIRTTAADLIEDMDQTIVQIKKERMVDELSEELRDFAEELDPYDYIDVNHTPDEAKKEMKEYLICEKTEEIVNEIKEIMEEQNSQKITEKGLRLIEKLDEIRKLSEQKTIGTNRRKEEAER